MKLEKLIARFDHSLWKPQAMRIFQILVYSWFVFNLLYLLPAADLVWGRDSMILPLSNQPGLVNNLFFLLNYMRDLDVLILSIHGLALLLALFGKLGWIPRLVVYVTAGMLYFPAYLALNGGYILMWIFSFYLIFAKSNPKDASGILLSNFSYMACVVQFLLVYTIAAWWKWTGTDWINGDALFYVLHTEAYSSNFLQSYLLPQEGLLKLMTWFGLIYQSLFFVFVWIKRTKLIWLSLGLLFHLFIIFGIGLVDFGTAMIIGYTLFLEDDWIAKILGKIKPRICIRKSTTT